MRRLDAADQALDDAAAPEPELGDAKARNKKWKAAADAYGDFLTVAGAGHRLRGYALHRRSRALWNAGEADAALEQLAALVQHSRASSQQPGARELLDLARADLAPMFADSAHQPGDVPAWVAGVAGSAEEATGLMAAVGEAYLAAGRYDEARAVFKELQSTHPGADGCVYGARGLAVTIVERPADRAKLMQQVQEQLALRERVESSNALPADTLKCRAATIAPIVELLSAWRTEAIGWKGVRGSGDTRAIDSVEGLLRALAESFESAQLGDAVLRDIPAENRPSIARVAMARAELARVRRKHQECGPLFEAAFDLASKSGVQATATDGALACYEATLREQHNGWWPNRPSPKQTSGSPDPRSPRPDPTLTKLTALASRSLCLVEPAETDPLGMSRRLDVELMRGRIEFLEGRWERAATALARLAFEQGHSQAREAAAMHAIALYRLGQSGNAACAADLVDTKSRLEALHCQGSDGDAPLRFLGIPDVTTQQASASLTPCEALRALGAPPDPPPPPPPRGRASRYPLHADGTWVMGRLVPEAAAWALRLHAAQLGACYAGALRRDPFFEPRSVELNISIARDGSVSHARINYGGFASSHLSSCLERVLGTMSFPQPEGGRAHVSLSARLSPERGLQLSPGMTVWQSHD